MTRKNAVAFVRYHGVVLESARGLEPSLAEHIAGGPIHGSWWSHPLGHEIYELTEQVRSSDVILVCGLARGRVTYVHRRLWPSFIRLADRFPAGALDRIEEAHLPSGRHKRQDVAFPAWVPDAAMSRARAVPESDAVREIQRWLARYGEPTRPFA